MKITIKEERPVRTLKDLQKIRSQLERASNKKLQTIGKRIDRITINTNPDDIYDEILEKFDLQHSIMNMLPMFLKYKQYILNTRLVQKAKENVRKPKFIILSSLVGGLATIFYIKRRKPS